MILKLRNAYISTLSVNISLRRAGLKCYIYGNHNKEKFYELYNFIYYKISTIVKVLLAHMTPRAFLAQCEIPRINGQMCLALNFNS